MWPFVQAKLHRNLRDKQTKQNMRPGLICPRTDNANAVTQTDCDKPSLELLESQSVSVHPVDVEYLNCLLLAHAVEFVLERNSTYPHSFILQKVEVYRMRRHNVSIYLSLIAYSVCFNSIQATNMNSFFSVHQSPNVQCSKFSPYKPINMFLTLCHFTLVELYE